MRSFINCEKNHCRTGTRTFFKFLSEWHLPKSHIRIWIIFNFTFFSTIRKIILKIGPFESIQKHGLACEINSISCGFRRLLSIYSIRFFFLWINWLNEFWVAILFVFFSSHKLVYSCIRVFVCLISIQFYHLVWFIQCLLWIHVSRYDKSR